MSPTTKNLAESIMDRMKSSALVVVVQEADEALARSHAEAVAEAFPPVRVVSSSGRCFRDDERPSNVGQVVDVGGLLSAHVTGKGTLVLLDTLSAYDSPIFARQLREVALQVREDGEQPSRIILVDRPDAKVPAGIVGDTDILVSALPSVDDLRQELDDFIAARDEEVKGNGEGRHALASALAGLPRHEAAHLLARCVVEHGSLDAAWLRREKAVRVTARLGGALTFERTDGPDIGGADALREAVVVAGKALGKKAAREFGLPEPKGFFLAGTPGSGKSEFARYAARLLEMSLLRLDVGRVMGGIVGESERNMRQAQEAIAACAPCVLLLDEIDKGFGGVTGPSGDSGTSQRVFGSFLTFLAENEKPVFIIATANRAWTLPAEFLRSGRFDSVFYLGTPTIEERVAIFGIHLKRQGWLRSAQSNVKESDIGAFAEATADFSGAEVRQAVIRAGFAAFAEGRKIEAADVLAAAKRIVPIVKTAPEDVRAMEEWSVKAQALRASAPPATVDVSSNGGTGRRIPKPKLSGGN